MEEGEPDACARQLHGARLPPRRLHAGVAARRYVPAGVRAIAGGDVARGPHASLVGTPELEARIVVRPVRQWSAPGAHRHLMDGPDAPDPRRLREARPDRPIAFP